MKRQQSKLLGQLLPVLVLLLSLMIFTACQSFQPAETTTLQGKAAETTIEEDQQADVETGREAPDGTKYGGRVIVAAFQDPKGLNPLAWAHGIHWDIMPTIYDGLFWVNENSEALPELVEDFTISDDGLTYTLKLREGVKWHDGEEFTAEDVEFSILAWLNPALGHFMGAKLSMLAGTKELLDGASIEDLEVKPVEVVDSHTVKLNLNGPSSSLVYVLASHPARIVPKHIMGELPVEDWMSSSLNTNPVGTGPFLFKEFRAGEALVLVAFDEYHAGRPYLDELVFRTIPETSVQATELMAGNVDYIRYPPETMYRTLENESDIKTLSGTDIFTWRTLLVNLNSPFLQDLRVRKAIQHALDRDEVVNGLFKGNASVSTQPMAKETKWHNPNVSNYSHDLEKAKELLAEAGWTLGSDGVLEKDGERFSIKIVTTIDADWTQVAVYVQEQLRKIGIEATVDSVDYAVFVENMHERAYDLLFISMSGDVDPGPVLYQNFNSASPENVMDYHNPEVDELTTILTQSVDEQERLAAMERLMEIVTGELPHIFIYHPIRFYATNSKLEGIKFHPMTTHPITWLREAYWTEPGH